MTPFVDNLTKLPEKIREDRDIFRKLFKLGLPIAIQNLVATSLNMVDTLMIGQLGETAIAAVALSNQIFFLMMLLLFGISSGTAVFTAQFWGKGDKKGIHRALGIALTLGFFGAVFFTLVAQLLPEQILGIFTEDQDVIRAAVPYLRITSASYLFTAGTIIFEGVMRSIGIVRLPLVLSVSALSLNAFFNYALIFGKFGLPELGITGAALATTGARVLEMTVLISITYIRRYPVAAGFEKLFDWNRDFLKRYAGKIAPVILNEVGWSMGITMFTLVYARMGTSVLAAYNITDTISRLCFVVFIGSANAAAIILGNLIGKGKESDAFRIARTIMTAVPLFTAFFSLLIVLAAPYIPLLFKVSTEVTLLITTFLRLMAVIILVKTSNLHLIVGVLRSGGDTRFCATIELMPLWFVSIPLVAFCGLVLQLPPPAVYAVAMSEEIIKYVLGIRRMLTGKWIHNLTD